jgi:hypothetical protein
MGGLYDLKDKTVCPPGGFIFTRKDGTRFEGCYSVSTAEACQSHHGLSQDDAWQKVLHETYANMPAHAREHFIVKNTEVLVVQNPTFRYVPRELFGEGEYFYNPGLIEHQGDDFLVYRKQLRNSDSSAWWLNFRTHETAEIKLPKNWATEQFEDPRVWRHCGALYLIVSSWRKDWQYVPLLRMFRLNDDWTVAMEIPLTYGGNGRGTIQKNWMFFSHEGELYFVYHYAPFQVVGPNTVYSSKKLTWKYGEIRGGTPPGLVDGKYFTFFHSRLDHGRSKYYTGCLAFDGKAPFDPLLMTMEPLLTATNREPNHHWTPLTTFPCGSIYKEGRWCVSLGVNDLNCALVDYEHKALLALMHPV